MPTLPGVVREKRLNSKVSRRAIFLEIAKRKQYSPRLQLDRRVQCPTPPVAQVYRFGALPGLAPVCRCRMQDICACPVPINRSRRKVMLYQIEEVNRAILSSQRGCVGVQ